MSDPFPDEIDETLWNEACRRADAIRSFLKNRVGSPTTRDVVELAAELDVSQATAYRLIKLFRAGGTVLSLVDRKRGRPEGHRVLDNQREAIVRATIHAFYLKRNRPAVSQLVRDVQTNCMSAGLKPPHRRTIVARLEDTTFKSAPSDAANRRSSRRQRMFQERSAPPAPWK
jgi:putative transposase